MFANVLQEIKGLFGRDFLLAAFFPILFFVSASAAIGIEVTQGMSATAAVWDKLSLLAQTVTVLGSLAFIALLAYLVQNFQYAITRLFEGYWTQWPLKSMRESREDLYKQRRQLLDQHMQSALQVAQLGKPATAQEMTFELLTFYPPEDKIMATRLGNILRASEVYAYQRYNIDSTIIWTRLFPLLKPEALIALQDRKTALDFMLLLSLVGIMFTVFWCPVLAIFTKRLDLFLLSALGWPLAWLCYQNAIQIAIAYGEQVKATFDLYRHDLLTALGRPTPLDLEAERKEWLRLSRFFYRNIPMPQPLVRHERPKGWERVAEALADKMEGLDRSTTDNDGRMI